MSTRCPSCGVINSQQAGPCAACRLELSIPPSPGDAWWETEAPSPGDAWWETEVRQQAETRQQVEARPDTGVYKEAIYAIVAGIIFALVRFVVVWPIANPFVSEHADGLEQAIGRLPWIAAPCAGLSGALAWWVLVKRPSFLKRGAMAGLLAAFFSYVGIGLFGGDLGFLFFAPVFTGWIVFPVLAIIGMLLGRLQQKLMAASMP